MEAPVVSVAVPSAAVVAATGFDRVGVVVMEAVIVADSENRQELIFPVDYYPAVVDEVELVV
jgi:hypothetical protein